MKKLSIFVFACILLLMFIVRVDAQTQNIQIPIVLQDEQLVKEIEKAIDKTLVNVGTVVYVREGIPVPSGGTGIILKKEIKEDGSIVFDLITALHVVSKWEQVLKDPRTEVYVIGDTIGGRTPRVRARIVAFDWRQEAIILEVVTPANLKEFFEREPVEIANLVPQEGEKLWVAGFPSAPVFGVLKGICNPAELNKIFHRPGSFYMGPGQEDVAIIPWHMVVELEQGYAGPGMSGGGIFRAVNEFGKIKIEFLGMIWGGSGNLVYAIPTDISEEVIKNRYPDLLPAFLYGRIETLKKFLSSIPELK